MKEENYLEGIYGCLERIEKKVEILSSAPVDKNNAVTGGETGIAMLREIRDGLERDLNGIRKSFSQYAGTLLAVSKSMQDVSGRNPLPDRTAEILAGIRKTGEQTSEEIKALLKTAGDNAKIRNEHRHTVQHRVQRYTLDFHRDVRDGHRPGSRPPCGQTAGLRPCRQRPEVPLHQDEGRSIA